MSSTFGKLVDFDLSHTDVSSHMYLDMSAVNSNYEKAPIDLQFSETRGDSIVSDAMSYDVSIARFSINTLHLPVWIPKIQLGQDSVNKTVYSFTMTFGEHEVQTYLTYIPPNPTILAPKAPETYQDMSNEYYFVFSFQYVVNLLNNTMTTCFNDLKTAVEGAGGSLPSAVAPWFSFDTGASELILNCDKQGFDESLASHISIYCNDAMNKMVSSFEFNEYNNPTNGKNYKFRVYNNYGQNVMELDNSLEVITVLQEYPCTGMWSPIDSIIFSSSNLPLRKSLLSKATKFGSTSDSSSFSDLEMGVLTDFQIAQTSGKESRGSIEMIPYFYRRINMLGHQEIKQVQIEVYWKDIYGNMYPLRLPSGCNASCKLVFLKKHSRED